MSFRAGCIFQKWHPCWGISTWSSTAGFQHHDPHLLPPESSLTPDPIINSNYSRDKPEQTLNSALTTDISYFSDVSLGAYKHVAFSDISSLCLTSLLHSYSPVVSTSPFIMWITVKTDAPSLSCTLLLHFTPFCSLQNPHSVAAIVLTSSPTETLWQRFWKRKIKCSCNSASQLRGAGNHREYGLLYCTPVSDIFS